MGKVGKTPGTVAPRETKAILMKEGVLSHIFLALTSGMATVISKDEEKVGSHTVERLATSDGHVNHGYEPKTAEARALDRRVNIKLDFVVVLVLAVDFILCGIDKTNIGYVATTSESHNIHASLHCR
jgi:hypothetical protein